MKKVIVISTSLRHGFRYCLIYLLDGVNGLIKLSR